MLRLEVQSEGELPKSPFVARVAGNDGRPCQASQSALLANDRKRASRPGCIVYVAVHVHVVVVEDVEHFRAEIQRHALRQLKRLAQRKIRIPGRRSTEGVPCRHVRWEWSESLNTSAGYCVLYHPRGIARRVGSWKRQQVEFIRIP
jgi:hypothetical protein